MLFCTKNQIFAPEKKIALFIPSLTGGGAERVIISLANAFVRRGYKVDLVLVKAKGEFILEVNSNVNIVDLNKKRAVSSIFALSNYFKKESPGVILSAMSYVNIVAIISLLISGVSSRLVISEHSTLSKTLKEMRWFSRYALLILIKILYKKAAAVIAVSNGVADDLALHAKYPRGRIAVIFNPIEIQAIKEKSLVPLAHPWFGSYQPPVIIGVGRLSREKDFKTLISAFDILREDRHARLVIVGDGPEKDFLISWASKIKNPSDVLFAGFQKNPYNWMRNASVLVLSSRREGFGNVIVEAMACGTPVVCTRCPHGPDEILDGGKWGELVPVGDAHSLAESIALVLDKKTHPDIERRSQEFDVSTATENYLKILGFDHN